MNKRKQLTIEQRQKQSISRLKNENLKLRAENKELKEVVLELSEKLEKALLHIEELQKYVFRGKKKPKDKDPKNKPPSGGSSKRKSSSYRRAIPEESEITNFRDHRIFVCPDCKTKLNQKKTLKFYEEDIIPIIEWFEKLRKITQIKIETGYCPHCKKRFSSIPIPKQKVAIGENIKQLIVFQSTVQQLSYSQITDFLESHLQFKVSSGEIANILSKQALKLKPAWDDLIKSIRSGPGIHMDETSYKVAFPDESSGNYAWAMSGVEEGNTDTVFKLGKNRGRGNAQDLIGENYPGVGVSDDYGAYTNLFSKGKHALCWAHPHRKFRDLKDSPSLKGEKKKACDLFYDEFADIYREVRIVNQTDFEKTLRIEAVACLRLKLEKILKPNLKDPFKLQTLKKTMLKKIDRYFVCLTVPGIPVDNNKAERSLRHLVIKRKKSFGSKTPKGAWTMSILYSVVMSLWWRSKKDFFKNYGEVVGGQ
jgi:transposase